jgi:hypothetical protein
VDRHLVNHGHECPDCGRLHLVVIDLNPFMDHLDRKLKLIHAELRKLGRHMATATEQLNALSAKVDDLVADVRAALAVINGDELSTDAQAALDAITVKVDAFDTEVGDADGSDTTPV